MSAQLRPVPPLWRDAWGWVCMLALLVLLAHARGAPLGEPVAEDFDFLHRALLLPSNTFLDGGGSTAFWRPVAHQLYYEILGGLMLNHPGLVAALHTVLFAVATLLLYRALRLRWPGPAAAFVASFPLLSESSRTLLGWPSHFVDLGAWLFTALAFHEVSRQRLWTALGALLAALLCKEMAVFAALLLPWMPGIGPTQWRDRVRWSVATTLVVVAWAATYFAIRQGTGMVLPHGLEAAAMATPWLERFRWSLENSLRAMVSLPATPVLWEGWLNGAAGILCGLFLVTVLLSRSGRARLRRTAPAAIWGAVWFLASAATLTAFHPFWAPNRSGYGSLGFGVMCAGLLGALHPLWLAALTVLRLTTFALSPPAPTVVTTQAPETGAFMDFQRLVRLQRLMRDTRDALKERYPTLPHGAAISTYFLPKGTEYAYGGGKALQIWYGDTTLRWVRFLDFQAHREQPVIAFIEFLPARGRQIALVEADAVRRYLEVVDAIDRNDLSLAMEHLDQADSLDPGGAATAFASSLAGARALCLMGLERYEDAEREARRSVELWHESPDGRFVIGYVAFERGRLVEAEGQMDTLLAFMPDDRRAQELRDRIREARRTR